MTNDKAFNHMAANTEPIARDRAWFAIILSICAVVFLEHNWSGNGLSALFILITCAACWILGGRTGYLVAAISAILVITSRDFATLPLWEQASKHAVRVTTLLLLAVMVTQFRRSFDRAHYLSEHDRMTGALNKEIFEARARALLQAAARSGEKLLLAILDLDDFKALNTNYGHPAGDMVLRVFSEGASKIIRRQDDFGRIGGDEFALLVRLAKKEDGPAIATLLHTRLSAALASSGYPVTCSMGVLIIPPDLARDEAALLLTVDQLMYDVKQAGKNAVKIDHARTQAAAPAVPSASADHQMHTLNSTPA